MVGEPPEDDPVHAQPIQLSVMHGWEGLQLEDDGREAQDIERQERANQPGIPGFQQFHEISTEIENQNKLLFSGTGSNSRSQRGIQRLKRPELVFKQGVL